MTDDARYQRARARAAELAAFYRALIGYVGLNVFLFLINLITSAGTWWFIWPLLGTTIGIGFYAARVFGGRQAFGGDWEERKTQEIMAKEDQRDR
jgi:hypothetical protein